MSQPQDLPKQQISDSDTSDEEPPELITLVTPEEREGTIPRSDIADYIAKISTVPQGNPTPPRGIPRLSKRKKNVSQRSTSVQTTEAHTVTPPVSPILPQATTPCTDTKPSHKEPQVSEQS